MPRRWWLYTGLFAATFATLLLEILDARLLSVLTWYHLSFLAVSLAMLGMAAGAVRVFLSPEMQDSTEALRRLPGLTEAFAASVVVSHIICLCIPIPALNRFAVMEVVAIAAVTTVLAVPFFFSGMVVTIALTRAGGPIGRLYAWDLAGAAAACIAVVPLLDSGRFNVTSLTLIAAAAAALAALAFSRLTAGTRLRPGALAAVCLLAAFWNGSNMERIEVNFPKNRQFWMATPTFDATRWNSHSFVILQRPVEERNFLWGPGRLAPNHKATLAWMAIDGEAGTPITRWDGNVDALEWVQHDVTSLPYHLRRGSAAIIGTGGGRDILSALWGRNAPVVGIDVNAAVLEFLSSRHRDFANIATRPEVELVHDDARAYLTRTDRRFDILQMSLIDTWAATGAGAFTLTENGLYTVDGWKIFLSRLQPNGVFSVSRWFSPTNVSETHRLLSLAVASLLELNIRRPVDHLLLVTRDRTATLLTSLSPFTAEDEMRVRKLADAEGFTIQSSPWTGGSSPRLDRIVRSTSGDELALAIEDPDFDYSAPTDERPFFFNMLKPRSFASVYTLPRGGVLWGNIRATATLILLFGISVALVAGIIVWPLVTAGRPDMPMSTFLWSVLYFCGIGIGFMLVQIALLQRFSVFLGHPAYTFSVTLFAMILFAGAGSYLSDFLVPRLRRPELALPLVGCAVIIVAAFSIGAATRAAGGASLAIRVGVVIAFLAPIATVLGFFFPTGLKAVGSVSPAATAWMWGVNGACGVLGSVLAVAVSMWVGIHANLIAAAGIYAGLAVPLLALRRASPLRQPAGIA
jgi:SAM-dependent methyltransferase